MKNKYYFYIRYTYPFLFALEYSWNTVSGAYCTEAISHSHQNLFCLGKKCLADICR